MSSPVETKTPAIPAITSDNVVEVLKALKELIEVRDGVRGDALDQMVTWRELQDSGIASVSGGPGGTGGGKPTLRPPENKPVFDVTVPPALTNLVVSGGYTQMFLSWDKPLYNNFALVRVFRSLEDVVGGAVLIGTTSAQVYSDPCGSSKTYYYWISAVTTSDVEGPKNSVHGTVGSTAVDVEYLLEQLTGAITETQLYADLGTRIDMIDAADTVIGSVSARVAAAKAELGGALTAVTYRVTQIEDTDLTLASSIETLLATQNAGDAATVAMVQIEQTARITADTALSSRIDTLTSSVDTSTAALITEQTARATADSANASDISTLISRANASDALISSNYTVLSNSLGSQATAINTLTTTTNGHTASITTQASTLSGLSAQYTVKIDNNGYVSGFGLASTTVYGTPFSEFIFRADRFSIGSPGYTTKVPFAVVTTGSLPGVYMDAAFIKDGTITNAKIGNAVIDNAKIASLDAGKIVTGTLSADRLDANSVAAKMLTATTAYINYAHITDTLQSTNFSSGASGWKLMKDGTAEINNLTVRGNIASYGKLWWQTATDGFFLHSGTTNGAGGDPPFLEFKSGTSLLQIGPQNGFYIHTDKITINGAAGTATFGGALAGADGTFSGTLTAQAVNAIDTINIKGHAVGVSAYQFVGPLYQSTISVNYVLPYDCDWIAVAGGTHNPSVVGGNYGLSVQVTNGVASVISGVAGYSVSTSAASAGSSLAGATLTATVDSADPSGWTQGWLVITMMRR